MGLLNRFKSLLGSRRPSTVEAEPPDPTTDWQTGSLEEEPDRVSVQGESYEPESYVDNCHKPESIEITISGRHEVTERVDVYDFAKLGALFNRALDPGRGEPRFQLIRADDDLGYAVATDEEVRGLKDFGYID